MFEKSLNSLLRHKIHYLFFIFSTNTVQRKSNYVHMCVWILMSWKIVPRWIFFNTCDDTCMYWIFRTLKFIVIGSLFNYFLYHPAWRKQLDLRLQPDGSDFRQAVAKEVAFMEQKHGQRESELQEKLAEGKKQYAALEDEFRMALTIEAARFSEVCHSMESSIAFNRSSPALVFTLQSLCCSASKLPLYPVSS